MYLVILESPYAGGTHLPIDMRERDKQRNILYARACMKDCLNKGEAPFLSHLLYTQVLDDDVKEERALGINEMKPEVKKRFLEISKDNYGNDHGHALEGLIKYHDGLCNTGHEEIETKIDILADEINKVKEKVDSLTEEKKTPEGYVKSPDGSKLIKNVE